MGFACLELFGTRVEQSELKTKSDGVYEMIFWAILCAVVGTNGPVTMMHVGSFTSLADCEEVCRSIHGHDKACYFCSFIQLGLYSVESNRYHSATWLS
jgi:hypothetical protein